MAYIIQQRRDTAINWSSVNPVLADAEIGFIKDIDENGKQKSSLYKIGDGKTAWNELPLFGYGGTVYGDFYGDDLTTSVASRQAILNKINELIKTSENKTNSSINTLKNDVLNGDEDFEGLINKLSDTQLVQLLNIADNEFKQDDDINGILASQIVSRLTLINEFTNVWNAINANSESDADFVSTTEEQLATLNEFATTYGAIIDTYKDQFQNIDKHEKYIYGWEEGEGENIVKHKSVDERFNDITNSRQILSKSEYNILKSQDKLKDYPEGTVFMVYEDIEE